MLSGQRVENNIIATDPPQISMNAKTAKMMLFSGLWVESNIIFAVLAFMLIWGGSVVAMTMLLLASGLDIITAFSAGIGCICKTRPGADPRGAAPTHAGPSDFQNRGYARPERARPDTRHRQKP